VVQSGISFFFVWCATGHLILDCQRQGYQRKLISHILQTGHRQNPGMDVGTCMRNVAGAAAVVRRVAAAAGVRSTVQRCT